MALRSQTDKSQRPPGDEEIRGRESFLGSSFGREGGYLGVTPITAKLLQNWTDPDREKKLFFCQVEALETIIYVSSTEE